MGKSSQVRHAPGNQSGAACRGQHARLGGRQHQLSNTLEGPTRSGKTGDRLVAGGTPHQGRPHGANRSSPPASVSADRTHEHFGTESGTWLVLGADRQEHSSSPPPPSPRGSDGIDEDGPDALVQLPQPVNKFPDFVRYVVQRLRGSARRWAKSKSPRRSHGPACTWEQPRWAASSRRNAATSIALARGAGVTGAAIVLSRPSTPVTSGTSI